MRAALAVGSLGMLGIFLGACWRDAPPDPPPHLEVPAPASAGFAAYRPRAPSECARVLADIVEKLRPELAKAGVPESTIDELQDAATASCEQMAWSGELIACYAAATTPNDLGPCHTLMTPEQTDDITRRMMEIVSRVHAVPPPPP